MAGTEQKMEKRMPTGTKGKIMETLAGIVVFISLLLLAVTEEYIRFFKKCQKLNLEKNHLQFKYKELQVKYATQGRNLEYLRGQYRHLQKRFINK